MGDFSGLVTPGIAKMVTVQGSAGLGSAGPTGEVRASGGVIAGIPVIGGIMPSVAISDTYKGSVARGTFGIEAITTLPLLVLPALGSTTIGIDTTGHVRASAGLEFLLPIKPITTKGTDVFSLGIGWRAENVAGETAHGAYVGFRWTAF